MKRSVRNGLAVAGMAGGMWLLGHAVANADTDQSAAASNTSSSQGPSSSDGSNVAAAGNSNSTTVETGDIKGGNGGTNSATINTGSQPPSQTSSGASPNTSGSGGGGGGGGGSSTNVSTGSVAVSQQANGGSVNGSGNVHVDNSVSQSASASNTTSQSSSSQGGGSKSGSDQHGNGNSQDSQASNDVSQGDGGNGGGNRGGNDSSNAAFAGNENSTDVYTGDIRGGRGGDNLAEVNTGVITWEPAVYGTDQVGRDEHGRVHVRATTGSVWVRQEANGGDVNDSGNVDVNGTVHQSASAGNDVTQTSSSADRRRSRNRGNDSDNLALAGNANETTVETGDIRGGRGGSNELGVNTGAVLFGFGGGEMVSTLGEENGDENGGGDRHGRGIDADVSTGDVWASQEANGGDVNGSGNVCVDDSTTQAAWAGNEVTQNSSSQGDKGREGNRGGGNDSDNLAAAGNVNSTDVYTGDIRGGRGGWNDLTVNTGAFVEPYYVAEDVSGEGNGEGDGRRHHDSSTVDVSTGDVWASQEANGGDVNDSGNVSVSNDVTQGAWAGNDVSQNSSSQGGRESNRRGGNDSDNAAFSFNDNETTVDTGDIKGGNGGWNSLDVNTGYEGSGYYGYLPSSLDITTGDVWVSQEANGGDVNGSGNVSVGSGAQCGCEKAAPKPGATAGTPATPAAPAAVKAAATKKKSTVMSSAQPTGTLAKTGADTEAPLAAGLLALGAGAALTLAGRRRREVDAA